MYTLETSFYNHKKKKKFSSYKKFAVIYLCLYMNVHMVFRHLTWTCICILFICICVTKSKSINLTYHINHCFPLLSLWTCLSKKKKKRNVTLGLFQTEVKEIDKNLTSQEKERCVCACESKIMTDNDLPRQGQAWPRSWLILRID